jgi:hypothetical protein
MKMPEFANAPSFSEDAKMISAFMAQRLKPLGFKKRRNGFNQRIDNGLIHQLSIFTVGAYSIDHGKFYVHAGCYVPEAELYRKNVIDPNWVTDGLCSIRGFFPKSYLSVREVAANLDLLTSHLNDALEALAYFNHYDSVTGDTNVASPYPPKEPLWFETPQPLVKACIQFTRGDREGASTTVQQYLSRLKANENPHSGHIEFVSNWLAEMRLQ